MTALFMRSGIKWLALVPRGKYQDSSQFLTFLIIPLFIQHYGIHIYILYEIRRLNSTVCVCRILNLRSYVDQERQGMRSEFWWENL
jgi:hypothetical protein